MAAFTSDEQREAFLAVPRLAILMTNRDGGAPIGVPVWFEWNGRAVEMFAAKDSNKIKRLERDSKISVLVTNNVGEAEAWVAFDGECKILADGAAQLIERIAPRYWDLNNAELKATIDSWIASEQAFVRLQLTPSRIRSGQ